MEAFFRKVYFDPKNPSFFTSIKKLRQAAIDAGYRASYGQVRRWLQAQETYGISREARTHFPRNHVTVSGLNAQWSADLCDFANIANENDGYAYFLIILDQFSRKAYAVKLKTKKPSDVIEAFKSVFNQGVRPKYSLYTDKGSEFTGEITRQFFKGLNIKQFFAANETKASSVERVLKTIKVKIHKYFLEKQHHRWVDILQDVVSGYNSSEHRSLGVSPNEVTSENEPLIRYKQALIRQKADGTVQKVQRAKEAVILAKEADSKAESKLSKRKKKMKKSQHSIMQSALPPRRKPKYKVGNLVRISRIKEVFKRAYDHQFTAEMFEIADVSVRDGIPVYKVISYELRDEVKGVFYEEELLKAYPRKSKNYKIGEILKTRGTGRRKEDYVSWFLHPKKYNSWVPHKSVHNLPNTKERKLVEKSKKAFKKSKNNQSVAAAVQSGHMTPTASQQSPTAAPSSQQGNRKPYQKGRQKQSEVRDAGSQQVRYSARLRAKKDIS